MIWDMYGAVRPYECPYMIGMRRPLGAAGIFCRPVESFQSQPQRLITESGFEPRFISAVRVSQSGQSPPGTKQLSYICRIAAVAAFMSLPGHLSTVPEHVQYTSVYTCSCCSDLGIQYYCRTEVIGLARVLRSGPCDRAAVHRASPMAYPLF